MNVLTEQTTVVPMLCVQTLPDPFLVLAMMATLEMEFLALVIFSLQQLIEVLFIFNFRCE